MLNFINQNKNIIETFIKLILWLGVLTGAFAIINNNLKRGLQILGMSVVFYSLVFISINL